MTSMPDLAAETVASTTPAPVWLDETDLRLWRECPRRFWLRHHVEAFRSAADEQAARQAVARSDGGVWTSPDGQQALLSSFPGAVTIDDPSGRDAAAWREAARRTSRAMADDRNAADGAAIFGAVACGDDGAAVRIDVLQRGSHGWRLWMVRYATVAAERDVDVIALWAHVAARAGWRVQSVGLLLVDTGFVYPGLGCYAGLFREVDVGPRLGSRHVPSWLVGMRATLRGPEPATEVQAPCSVGPGCAAAAHCLGQDSTVNPVPPERSVDLLGRELGETLRTEGWRDLADVPEARLTNARHLRMWRAVQSGVPVVDGAGAAALARCAWPRNHLRFETIGFAVPPWPGTRPYEILPFQWSVATQYPDGTLAEHSFVAEAGRDPRREFVETLLEAVEDEGAVLAYNAGFERNRLRELAVRFDDLAPAIEMLLARIEDVFQWARESYYDPVMVGSWSVKAMARSVLSVDEREAVLEGEATMAVFARSLRTDVPADERGRAREALVRSGRLRTLMLRRLIGRLERAGEASEL